MPHYVAFLRGINLGYRRVKMDDLRRLFAQLKFSNVVTFIASGNVLFETAASDDTMLATQIERHLAKSLGYEVETFVRTRAEVAAIVAHSPFPQKEMTEAANTIHVGFLRAPPDAATVRGLAAVRTGVDEFAIAGREFYWLCRIRTPDSKVWASPQLTALRPPRATMRNLKMLRRLAAQFPAPAG